MDKIQYDSKTVGSTVQNMEELSSDDKALAKDVKLMLQNKFENREKMPENNSILKSSSAKKIEIEDDLFQSFRCFITGFSPRHTKIICDQIRNGGGYIFDQITPSITHIICSTKNAAVI